MFTESGPRLGWRTGASRLKMKPQLDLLQSFDPGERTEAGRELVEMGVTRTAHALLDHVANEFDDRVLAAIASAVRAAPIEEDETRRARELRQWAVSELDRLRLEDAFMSGAPSVEPPIALAVEPPPPAPDPIAQAAALRAELDAPGPVIPERTPASWAPPTQPESLPYIFWRAPVELIETASAPSAVAAPEPTSIPVAPPAPAPQEVRFEPAPDPAPTRVTADADPPSSGVTLTLAERLKARTG